MNVSMIGIDLGTHTFSPEEMSVLVLCRLILN